MLYGNFVEKINAQYKSLLATIEAEYNFDVGYEYENAICNFLRKILPDKFGVCRGFIVNKEGVCAGDDVIIYDRYKLPALRFFPEGDWSLKQRIPVEAVYAYIEVKSTLDENTLPKALEQVISAKKLLRTREKVPLSLISEGVYAKKAKLARENPSFPDHWNPPFTAIIGKKVKIKGDNDYSKYLLSCLLPRLLIDQRIDLPDLMIADQCYITLPAIEGSLESPFTSEKSVLTTLNTEHNIGVGIIDLLYAIDSIKLGPIHWPGIIADGLGLNLKY
jgi:hypothetical protein